MMHKLLKPCLAAARCSFAAMIACHYVQLKWGLITTPRFACAPHRCGQCWKRCCSREVSKPQRLFWGLRWIPLKSYGTSFSLWNHFLSGLGQVCDTGTKSFWCAVLDFETNESQTVQTNQRIWRSPDLDKTARDLLSAHSQQTRSDNWGWIGRMYCHWKIFILCSVFMPGVNLPSNCIRKGQFSQLFLFLNFRVVWDWLFVKIACIYQWNFFFQTKSYNAEVQMILARVISVLCFFQPSDWFLLTATLN